MSNNVQKRSRRMEVGFIPMRKKPPHPEFLNLNILYEILLRLPVKTLSRFRCVSKSWSSIISLPCFQKDHYLVRSHQNPFLVIVENEFDKISFTVSIAHLFTYNNEGTLNNRFSITLPGPYPTVGRPCAHLIQSCRGLICLRDPQEKHIFLCNPSTKEHIELPPINIKHCCIGFGYAAATDEYKVVRYFRIGTMNYCEVFTLGASEWREARCPPPQFQKYVFFWDAPFVNGAIHLLPLLNYYEEVHYDDSIAVFNLESEEYTSIRLPECYYDSSFLAEENRDCSDITLRKLGGSLCFTFIFENSIGSYEGSLELWLLKDYDLGQWVREYIIDITSLSSRGLCADVLVIMADGSLLLTVYAEGHEWLCSYDPQLKTFTHKLDGICSIALYVESFKPLGRRLLPTE